MKNRGLTIKTTGRKILYTILELFENRKKQIITGVLVSLGLLVIFTNSANAQTITGIASSAVAAVVTLLTWLISTIFAIVIGLETYIIDVLLNISLDIINSPVVQVGFPITLSIANLAFVVGLIIMAIATIIRNTSYNAKQMLFKLVTAAILVNFSLIIAGSLLRVSDIFTSFFVREVSPFSNSNTKDAGDFFNFTSSIAGAFQPQKAFTPPPEEENPLYTLFKHTPPGQAVEVAKGVISGEFLGDVKTITVAWAGLILQLITQIGIVITLGFLVVMLVYRYVTLLFLLILMPLAWVMYTFKDYEVHWNSWWKEFIKQLIFAPVVVFFLYLAIQTEKELGGMIAKYNKIPTTFDTTLQGQIGSAMAQILSMLTISGIMLGGMLAASKLGHETGKTAVSAIKGASSKITGTLLTRPAGRVGRGVGLAVATSKAGKGTSQLLQNLVSGVDTKNLKGINKLGAQAFNAITTITGTRKLARIAGSSLDNQTKALSEAQKKSYAEEIKGDSRNINKARLNGQNLTGTEFVEAIKTALAGGYIAEIKNLEEQLAKNKDAFANIDEKSLYQKLGGFHYENKEVDKTDANGAKIRKKNPETNEDEVDATGQPVYEKETRPILVGDRTLLADTKIAEIKKQFKEKNTSEAQIAAILNDEEELRKTDKDKIIAILEILDKEDKLPLVKDYEKVINYLTKKRDEKGAPTVEDDRSFTKLNAAGIAEEATYTESIGKDKFIGKVKNTTGLSLIEASNLDESDEKYQKIINGFVKSDNKSIAALISNNLQTINTPGVTPEQLEQSQTRIAMIYKNLGEIQAEKMNGIIKELANNDSFTRAAFERSIKAVQEGTYSKGKQINIQLSKSVIDQAEKKPHMQAGILGTTLPELVGIKIKNKEEANQKTGGTGQFFTQQKAPSTGQGNPTIEGFQDNSEKIS